MTYPRYSFDLQFLDSQRFDYFYVFISHLCILFWRLIIFISQLFDELFILLFFNDWVYTFQMIINYQNKYFSFQDLFVCAHVCVRAHAMCIVCTLSCTGQEKWLDFLELGCQAVVSCLTWVVRSELRFSGEAEGALHSNCLCSPRIVNS